MESIEKVVTLAKSQIGYLEKSRAAYEADKDILDDFTAGAGSDNITKYSRDLWAVKFFNGEKQGVAWCSTFVSWVFCKLFGRELALKLLCQPEEKSAGAGCGAASNYYKSKGRWFTAPEVGDQIFFTDGAQMTHTGLVVNVEENNITTVEGNSSGGVRQRSYSTSNSRIAGYGRPRWDLVEGGIKTKQAKVVLPTGGTGKTVRLRAKPSANGYIIDNIPVGTVVEVDNDAGEWVHVQVGSKTGYMNSNYIEYVGQPSESDEVTFEQRVQIDKALLTIEQAVDIIGGIIGRG